jgi:hypothetical protein
MNMDISKCKTYHKQTFRYILTNDDTETDESKQIRDTNKNVCHVFKTPAVA